MLMRPCECDELPAHFHIWRAKDDPDPCKWEPEWELYDVRIVVDWKQVARELMTDFDVEADAAAHYAQMVGHDLPMDERRRRAASGRYDLL